MSAQTTPATALLRTTDNHGYQEVTPSGTLSTYGDASQFGSLAGLTLQAPVVGIVATPSGHGYWMVASDGGIFAFGDAPFYGSMGSTHLNRPVVGIATTPSGHGYWMVASDGGIFAFGDAPFYGSTGAITLNAPMVAMTTTPTGHGYWMVASDGGIFAFGDAPYLGSPSMLSHPCTTVSITATTTGQGYWSLCNTGAVHVYGDAHYYGDVTVPRTLHLVAIGDSLTTQSASYLAADVAQLSATPVNLTADDFPGTAPCDWLTRTQGRPSIDDIAATHPDIVTIEFVGNDVTSCAAPAQANGTLVTQYTNDLSTIIAKLLAAGVSHVIVIGPPALAPTAQFTPAAVSGQIFTAESALANSSPSPAVSFLDAGRAVETPTGAFTQTLPCLSFEIAQHLCAAIPAGPPTYENVRAPDGIHFCVSGPYFTCTGYASGAARFSGAIVAGIDAIYGLTPLPAVH
jgi:lysophospholipase L1-like esterase/ribosomal protein L24E